uniref:RAB6-interacting golgin n=1 Tax=Haemonchus placei TaxID=6290 RepID=A0A0N4X973_HAEPC
LWSECAQFVQYTSHEFIFRFNDVEECADEEIKMLKKEKRNIERENEALSFMIEEAETVRKEESGGSGGWSDFGDDIIEQMMNDDSDQREKTSASSRGAIPVASFTPAIDIREVTKLRIQLRKTEHELEAIRVALEYEKEERHQAISKLSSLENDLERRAKEAFFCNKNFTFTPTLH